MHAILFAETLRVLVAGFVDDADAEAFNEEEDDLAAAFALSVAEDAAFDTEAIFWLLFIDPERSLPLSPKLLLCFLTLLARLFSSSSELG